MRALYILSIAVTITLLSGCKKDELPEPLAEVPELYIQFETSGTETRYEAGVDGYYMHAYFQPVSDTDVVNPGYYAGLMHHYKEPETHPKIEIRFRNITTGPLGDSASNVLLQPGSLEFAGVMPETFYNVNFDIESDPDVSKAQWDFGDGGSSGLRTPVHLYNVNGPDQYQVCLTTEHLPGCTAEICTDIFMPDAPCTAEISGGLVDSINQYHMFRADVTGSDPVNYTWTLENDVEVKSAEIKYVYGSGASRLEHLRLQTTDGRGCVTNVAKKIQIGPVTTACYANISYSVQQVTLQDPGFKKVVIIYTDQNGVEYRSDLNNQPSNSGFVIDGMSEYLVNPQQLKTRAVDLRFTCRLFNANGDYIDLSNGKGRVAVAHP